MWLARIIVCNVLKLFVYLAKKGIMLRIRIVSNATLIVLRVLNLAV